MKTYKIKSFFYFLLFTVAAFIYNNFEQEQKFQDQITSSKMADVDMEELEDTDSEQLDTTLQQ